MAEFYRNTQSGCQSQVINTMTIQQPQTGKINLMGLTLFEARRYRDTVGGTKISCEAADVMAVSQTSGDIRSDDKPPP